MNQNKNGHFKSMRIRWKIFVSMFFVSIVILLILWSCQVLLMNSFYQSVKTEELKNATNEVIENIESANSQEIFDRITMLGDINIRIINISNFEDVYTGGDGLISATHDIGDFEILRLYNLALQNNGEVSCYYTYDREKQYFHQLPPDSKDSDKNQDTDFSNSETNPDSENSDDEYEKKEIGIEFFNTRPAFFMKNDRYVDDFLYAKLVTLDDGTELMVISDVQVTPLDSTVKILKSQLEITSLIAFIVALIVSFLVSRHISAPIVQLNNSALELARGKFDTEFTGKGYREIEQLSDTLNYTASELGKVEQFRRELLANVSHDLRTPLTMIGGYAEVMRDIPGENTPENVQVIIDETNRLTEFVNDILDLSKLQSGINSLEIDTVNITEMLDSIRTRYFNLTKKDGYTIEIQADEEVYVKCDENKISQAFYNLMDNAVNHTGEDKTVVIRQIVTDDKVRIEISDSGPGISPEELPYIWDRYYRAEGSHKRSVIGSGIGLSIVKSIFELHKLKYGVESKLNAGTVFWVEFDRQRVMV
ncbi:MAG: two-component sensor histidine kinase [Clostridiales bacterium]|nr:MAG: two-component sensor histidine kinase [Clostridiales bacterium]